MKKILLLITFLTFGFSWGQISESFETGLPTSYNVTLSNATLGSGTWQVANVIEGATGVQTGSKSAQIRSATAAQIITPTLSGGVGVISFYVTASTASGAYQVNISTDNGATWAAAPGSPFTIGTTKTFRSITVNDGSVNKVQIYRTGATIYIDDFATTTYSSGITSFQNGNWSNTATWVGGVVPTSADNAIIANGHVVTMDTTTGGINTRNSGTTTTVNVGGTLATDVQYINNGTTTINGTFQLNAGGYTNSGNNFVYGATGTLNFNNTSSYGVNNTDQYWPTTSGPFNVTILQGGMTLNGGANRTVAGTFQTAAGVTLNASLTLNGIARINGGGFFNNSPIYGASSTLQYYNNGLFGRGLEWSHNGIGAIGTTPGYPNNIQVSNNTLFDYPNGVPLNKALAGNLTIDSGSSFYMDYGLGNCNGVLTVAGNIVNNGNFTLGDGVGDDLQVAGNWTNTGVFNPNNRLVTFNGSTNQTITGATTFDYLTINNTANVTLLSNVTNNQTLDFTNGKLILGTNNITIGSLGTVSNATTLKYVVTNGAGQLKRTVAGASVSFPIGTATNYNPISATNSGTSDVYGFRVVTGVVGAVDLTYMVNDSWYVSEAVAGGSNIRVVPEWNIGDQGVNFNNTDNFIELHTPSIIALPATVTTTPYTATLTNVGDNFSASFNGTQFFAVAKQRPQEINIQQGATNIPTGGNYGFGNQLAGTSSAAITFTVQNTGQTNLSVGALSISGANASEFTITQAVLSTVAGGSTTTFTVTFSPASAGAKTAQLSLINNDSNENPYIINLTGTGTSNPSPNNGLSLVACIANNQVTLSWNASTGTPVPTGYIVFVQPNTTIPAMTAALAGNASGYIANTNYSLATAYGSLGKAVFKGNALTTTITGLTNLSQYTFKVVAYNVEIGTGWAPGINASGSWNQTYIIDVPEVSNLAASINPTTSTVTWNVVPSSAGCYEYMVVANAGAVSLTPTGNGSAYTANTVYAGVNSVVYKGTGNSVIVTGLTDNVNYCYKVFVRETNSGNQWSDGVSVCQTTGVDYCASTGGTNNSMIKNVTFNTINQSSTSTAGYSNYTAVNTSVFLGSIHDLSVIVNTNGNYTSYVKAWIDWNRNGTFDSNEAYELGTITNNANGIPSLSPFSITVPTNATIGNVRMRISANTDNVVNGYATPCESFTYGEVEDYTIIIEQPLNAEINVKGGTISIPNGFDAPYGLNNTLFATTPLNTNSIEKEFTIENIGIADLLLTGSPIIKIEGANPTEFIVTQQATTPVVNGTDVNFKIVFHPTVAGLRTANVRIESNDSDENPYIFAIEGNGNCTIAPVVSVFPTSGPANTLVTFTSATSSLIGATITYNNVLVPTILNTSNTIEVLVPIGANDGNFNIQLATGCNKIQAFDVIDTNLTACASSVSGGDASNLFIYEVYDENGGSGGVITIYNNTGAAVNLNTYSIQRAGTYGGSYSTYANLSGSIAAGAVAIVSVSSSSCGYTPTGNGSFGATGFNANDGFRLLNGATLIDDVKAPNYVGYYLKRKNTNFYPNTTFTASEWTTQSLSSGECLTGVGSVPVVKVPPTVTTNPEYMIDCAITGTSLTVAGSEGVSGGLALAYQWYVLGTSGNWTALSNAGIYSGATSATLNISNVTGLDNYQYYCQIREDSATCYTATNATLIKSSEKTWNGSAWSGDGLPPTSTQKIVLTGNLTLPYTLGATTYNVLEACSCQVNAGVTLTAGNVSGTTPATLVIQSAVVNNGVIVVNNNSSLVQVNETDTNTAIGTNFVVNRITNVKHLDYVYWSSPVEGFDVSGLPNNNRYYWDPIAVNANGSEGNFIAASGNMVKGRGYIARISNAFPTTPQPTNVVLQGSKPHNGQFTYPISRGSTTGTDDTWNLIGNPYPSAIDATTFLTDNTTIEGSVRVWKHGIVPAIIGSPFYQNFQYNYSENDYILYNGTASIPAGLFNGKIASGQGFFIRMLEEDEIDGEELTNTTTSGSSTVTFKNSFRRTSGAILDNSQFFKSTSNQTTLEKSRIWLDLIGPNNQISNTVVGYVEGATLAKDRMFDALIEVDAFKFYTLINTQKQAIQGRPLPFDSNDQVPMGIFIQAAGNYIIAISSVDGLFSEASQNIYLEDKLLNVIHDLRQAPYSFSSAVGEFNDRFVLRYTNTVLSNPTFENANNFVIVSNSQVSLSASESIKSVMVFDMLGRKIYEKNNINTTNVVLDKLIAEKQALIVKTTFENGTVIDKKIIY